MPDNTIGDFKTMQPGGAAGRSATLNPGDTLGQYKVVRLLGRGGMGEVYEVEHDVLRRRYALKLLPADFASRPGALERFKREARAMDLIESVRCQTLAVMDNLEHRLDFRQQLPAVGFCLVVLRPGKELDVAQLPPWHFAYRRQRRPPGKTEGGLGREIPRSLRTPPPLPREDVTRPCITHWGSMTAI